MSHYQTKMEALLGAAKRSTEENTKNKIVDESLPTIKTFTDKNGKKAKIGSLVRIYDPYNEEETEIVLPVREGYKQGADGTILVFDLPPMPHRSKHHFSHRASEVIAVSNHDEQKK